MDMERLAFDVTVLYVLLPVPPATYFMSTRFEILSQRELCSRMRVPAIVGLNEDTGTYSYVRHRITNCHRIHLSLHQKLTTVVD
jgi:hypothetical protein